MSEVYLVIVSYRPKENVLSRTVNSIINQVQKVIIVDNTENGYNFDALQLINKSNVEIVKLGENYGIAKAQNIGINMAIEEGAKYVMLSDQDSEYPPNYIRDMIDALLRCSSNNVNLAAIGPSFIDLNRGDNVLPFVTAEGFFIKRSYAKGGCIAVTRLIATGMIIPTEILKSVGGKQEDLFIDWVDLEWCWRAISKGYQVIGNADVIIKHIVGDEAGKFGFIEYSIHSPIRSYYIIRNRIHLALRCKYIGFGLKLRLFLGSFKLLIGFPVLASPSSEYLKFCLVGMYHGFIGRLGKF